MTAYSAMNASELFAASEARLETEHDLERLLIRASEIAEPFNPALAMLFRVLADEPSEIAASRSEDIGVLSGNLHLDTDGPTLANAVSNALAQFAA